MKVLLAVLVSGTVTFAQAPAPSPASSRTMVSASDVAAMIAKAKEEAGNGKFVAVDNEQTVLKSLGSAKPGIAESFQWVNLLRGDTMLMALTNHRYLATIPNTPGPVTATALGASPARRSGAEFKWTTVD